MCIRDSAGCEGGFEGGAAGVGFGLLEGDGAAVEVVAPLAGLSSFHLCVWWKGGRVVLVM